MDILSKVERKIKRSLCRHEWQFEGVTNTRQLWPRNRAFVYICEKCGSHKAINCQEIKERIEQYGVKDNYDYAEETVLLPNGLGPTLVEYSGRDVGRAVKWYWDHEGILISAYANKDAVKYGKIPDYGAVND